MTIISAVIPVFNESLLINELVSRVSKNLELITSDYRIILIDDGSTDETWNLISKAVSEDTRITGVRFSKNFGQHCAIAAGLKISDSEWVVVMDGDLQDRPEIIPDLYAKTKEGYDIVYVSRQNRPEKLYYRMLQKLFYKVLNLVSDRRFDPSQANFSIISRKVVRAIELIPNSVKFYASSVNSVGFMKTAISANHGGRYAGRPSYTFKKRVRLAFDIIFTFSRKPLRYLITSGFIVSVIGTLVIILGTFPNNNIMLENSFPEILIFVNVLLNLNSLLILSMMGIYFIYWMNFTSSTPPYIVEEII